jgi:hypothetical protein
MKMKQNDQKDAARYRFLRSEASRDHKHHTQRSLEVEIQDWGGNLSHDRGRGMGFWSSLPVVGADMDKAVDRAMKKQERK